MGNAVSASFVSCMHTTSGSHSANHASTRSCRALSELTFQVASRTASDAIARPRALTEPWPGPA